LKKLADTLSINIQEAEELFKLYAESFPALNNWLDKQAQSAVDNGYSSTFAPCKRRRYYPEINTLRELQEKSRSKRLDLEEWKLQRQIDGQIRRNGMNMPIQGSGADICKEALIAVRNLILEYNNQCNEEVAYLICTVHDAIDVEVREDLAKEFGEKMCELMIKVGNKYVSKVEMAVDVTSTKQWTK
jgi:DNA polymerase-1